MEADEVRRKPSEIGIGEELDSVSVEDLHHRITLLENEIQRIRHALERRMGVRSAAESLFRK